MRSGLDWRVSTCSSKEINPYFKFMYHLINYVGYIFICNLTGYFKIYVFCLSLTNRKLCSIIDYIKYKLFLKTYNFLHLNLFITSFDTATSFSVRDILRRI